MLRITGGLTAHNVVISGVTGGGGGGGGGGGSFNIGGSYASLLSQSGTGWKGYESDVYSGLAISEDSAVVISNPFNPTGGQAPYTYSLFYDTTPGDRGALPDGLTLNPTTGDITGTPTSTAFTSGNDNGTLNTNGLYSFMVVVTENDGTKHNDIFINLKVLDNTTSNGISLQWYIIGSPTLNMADLMVGDLGYPEFTDWNLNSVPVINVTNDTPLADLVEAANADPTVNFGYSNPVSMYLNSNNKMVLFAENGIPQPDLTNDPLFSPYTAVNAPFTYPNDYITLSIVNNLIYTASSYYTAQFIGYSDGDTFTYNGTTVYTVSGADTLTAYDMVQGVNAGLISAGFDARLTFYPLKGSDTEERGYILFKDTSTPAPDFKVSGADFNGGKYIFIPRALF